MKKILALLLVLVMVLALCACGGEKKPEETKPEETKTEETKTEENKTEEEVVVDPAPADETTTEETPAAVTTYADFVDAETETPVAIDAYLQAKQVYNAEYKNTSLYLQNEDGAFFVYHIALSQEDYDALTVGQKLHVTGFKGEWSGEREITDAAIEAVEGEAKTFEPLDITEFWGTVDMIKYQNQLVSFKGAKVEAYDEAGAAFAYKNPDEKTDDLYYKVTIGDTTYEFCVECDLCGTDSEVYKTVEGLKVGDTVDLEGFLYWYEGPNLHTTAVTVK